MVYKYSSYLLTITRLVYDLYKRRAFRLNTYIGIIYYITSFLYYYSRKLPNYYILKYPIRYYIVSRLAKYMLVHP